jgi:hypothetical protein
MSNALLASLSPGDAAVQPHLKNIDLEHKRVLFEAGDTVDQVYFRPERSYRSSSGSPPE